MTPPLAAGKEWVRYEVRFDKVLHPMFDRKKGKQVDVWCHTNYDQVELFHRCGGEGMLDKFENQLTAAEDQPGPRVRAATGAPSPTRAWTFS